MSTSVPPRDGDARTDSPIFSNTGLNDSPGTSSRSSANSTRTTTKVSRPPPDFGRSRVARAQSRRRRVREHLESARLVHDLDAALELPRRRGDAWRGARVQSPGIGAPLRCARLRPVSPARRPSAATQVSPRRSGRRFKIPSQAQHAVRPTHRGAARARRAGHEAASHMKAAGKRPHGWFPRRSVSSRSPRSIAGGAVRGSARRRRRRVADRRLAVHSAARLSEAGQIGSLVGRRNKVRIGPQTKFFVPDGFPKKIRALRVEGTASFEVAPGKTLPFRVVAKRMQVIATGTQFVVSAYPSDSGIVVTVREGSVTVKSRNKTSTVAAGQSMHVTGGTMSRRTRTSCSPRSAGSTADRRAAQAAARKSSTS